MNLNQSLKETLCVNILQVYIRIIFNMFPSFYKVQTPYLENHENLQADWVLPFNPRFPSLGSLGPCPAGLVVHWMCQAFPGLPAFAWAAIIASNFPLFVIW